MGKMKEVFMDQFNNEYQGSHDAFIHGLAQASIEEFIKEFLYLHGYLSYKQNIIKLLLILLTKMLKIKCSLIIVLVD